MHDLTFTKFSNMDGYHYLRGSVEMGFKGNEPSQNLVTHVDVYHYLRGKMCFKQG